MTGAWPCRRRRPPGEGAGVSPAAQPPSQPKKRPASPPAPHDRSIHHLGYPARLTLHTRWVHSRPSLEPAQRQHRRGRLMPSQRLLRWRPITMRPGGSASESARRAAQPPPGPWARAGQCRHPISTLSPGSSGLSESSSGARPPGPGLSESPSRPWAPPRARSPEPRRKWRGSRGEAGSSWEGAQAAQRHAGAGLGHGHFLSVAAAVISSVQFSCLPFRVYQRHGGFGLTEACQRRVIGAGWSPPNLGAPDSDDLGAVKSDIQGERERGSEG